MLVRRGHHALECRRLLADRGELPERPGEGAGAVVPAKDEEQHDEDDRDDGHAGRDQDIAVGGLHGAAG
jgi:hypothetical protein